MRDEFNEAQSKAILDMIAKKIEANRSEAEDGLQEGETPLEDLEDSTTPNAETIKKLTPSDDLEVVKRTVNDIIDALSLN